MPQHIITESVADHYKYKEAELNEADRRGWYGVVIALLGTPVIWWLFWHLHLVGLL
jgi:hypothetical protein